MADLIFGEKKKKKVNVSIKNSDFKTQFTNKKTIIN